MCSAANFCPRLFRSGSNYSSVIAVCFRMLGPICACPGMDVYRNRACLFKSAMLRASKACGQGFISLRNYSSVICLSLGIGLEGTSGRSIAVFSCRNNCRFKSGVCARSNICESALASGNYSSVIRLALAIIGKASSAAGVREYRKSIFILGSIPCSESKACGSAV